MMLDVNIDCRCDFLFFLSECISITVQHLVQFSWICASQIFIIFMKSLANASLMDDF